MVFKLVQIDGINPVKIPLEIGTHIFGRGKLLRVNDKRISRQHGQFEVTENSLIMTALHQNPCFYQKKEDTETQIMKLNSSVTLKSGDRLGLLPTSHWFELVKCLPMENEESCQSEKDCPEKTTEVRVDSSEETDNEVESRLSDNANVVTENDNVESQSTELLSLHDIDSQSDSTEKDLNKGCVSENIPITDKTEVDSRVLVLDSNSTHIVEPMSPSLLSSNQDNEEESKGESTATDQASAALKRVHSVGESGSSEEIKKIKTEPETEDKPAVKCEPDAQSGSSVKNDGVADQQAAAAAAPPPLRERCMYGASCYRRNPAHRAQYSHPGEAAWGSGPRAPCPYGAACGKRDPRHWRDHSHPPGKDQPPPPQPGGKRKRRRHRSDTPPDDLIVTGKRARRPVAQAGWSGSDSDSDPYRTDGESDEWEPSSEYTESQN